MRHLLLIGLATILLAGPLAAAHGEGHDVTLVAVESGCNGGHTFCFTVAAGGLDALEAGDEVVLTLRNDGQSLHNVYVTALADRDPNHRSTPEERTIARSPDLDAGESAELAFVVPGGVSGLYLWCAIAGHEQLGMWIEVPLATTGAGGGAGSGDGEKGSPGPSVLQLAGLLALGALVFRRR